MSTRNVNHWANCKKILCIRPDNMGDLIMSGPAIRALKNSFGAEITVLTSTMGAGIARFMPEIDRVIIFDLPWVKTDLPGNDIELIIDRIKNEGFDAAVIFTVFSQNPLPTATLTYMAGIPRVLSYCRENPYKLVSDWVVDDEPYQTIRHQVVRDLYLVEAVGATISDDNLKLTVPKHAWPSVVRKLTNAGVDPDQPYILMHPGVSEAKRLFLSDKWAEVARTLIKKGCQVILTGSTSETSLGKELEHSISAPVVNLTGAFDLAEFMSLIQHSALLLSVNTGTIHIAAATGTPVVVLYAQTNPQHTPWKVPHRVIEFPVPAEQQSRNEVIAYLQRTIYANTVIMPTSAVIVQAAEELLVPKK